MPTLPRCLTTVALALLASCVSDPIQAPPAPLPPVVLSAVDSALNEAELALRAGDRSGVRRALGRLPRQLDFGARTRRQLVEAELALMEDRPLVALQSLPRPWQVSEPALASRIERLRGVALFRMGDAAGAVRALVAREKVLTGNDLDENHALIWQGLREVRLADAAVRGQSADATTRGWLELARIRENGRLAGLQDWRQRYPQHPGDRFLDANEFAAEPEQPLPGLTDSGLVQAESLPAAAAGAYSSEFRVALLLPLTGPFAASAEAVRDGFFSAYFSTGPTPVRVRVYDTGSNGDVMLAAYEEALSDDAALIVGPMRKDDVAALAARGDPEVPVLALNYLDPGQTAPANFYQWGLAPEDEARQAAQHAHNENRLRAAALAPEGDWGDRVLAAFGEQMAGLGGDVVETQRYRLADKDHATPIRDLLNVNDSEERHRALSGILGKSPEFEPRRRGDVDFIFFASRADQARQLAPQLRFHRASGLPLYGLAQIYEGNALSSDLNGVRFCDSPWMIESAGPWRDLRQSLTTALPARRREQRLLALGHDAYSLAATLGNRQLSPETPLTLASGTVWLRPGGVLIRALECVEVAGGGLRPVASDGGR